LGTKEYGTNPLPVSFSEGTRPLGRFLSTVLPNCFSVSFYATVIPSIMENGRPCQGVVEREAWV
jgi:hypothetical protein